MYFIFWRQFKNNFLNLTEVKNGLQLSASLSAIKFLLCQTKHVSGTCFPTLLSFFPLLPESKRTDVYGDIITKFSWMDRLPNYLNNGALFVLLRKWVWSSTINFHPKKWLWSITLLSLLYIWTSLFSFLLLLKLNFTSTS